MVHGDLFEVDLSVGMINCNNYIKYMHDSGSYVSFIDDMPERIFIRFPPILHDHIKKISDSLGMDKHTYLREDERVIVPCIITDKSNGANYDYQGCVLSPPGISENDKWFINGLSIPKLKVRGVIGEKHSPLGFIVTSSYMHVDQEFYLPYNPSKKRNFQIYDTPFDVIFQGRLKIPSPDKMGRKRRPIVYPEESCSALVDELFLYNCEELEILENDNMNFWWNVNPSSSELAFNTDDTFGK